MSVLLETSLGDLVLDLDTEREPTACENFLKLCKAYKYNYCAFFSVQQNFLAQTGDPTSTGKEGASIWSQLPTSSKDYSRQPYFRPDRDATLKHRTRGTVSMALSAVSSDRPGDLVAGSQFFVTLADDLEYLDGKHAPFGMVVEGHEEGETLDKINAAYTDDKNRPMRDIRIKHVIVLDDPFPDPEGLHVPSRTPSPTPEQLAAIRLGEADEIEDDRPDEEKEEARRKADSSAAALTLEMVGDLPFAEIRPPENILFVCKLNPVTRSEDLELIFSRFGKILSCEVIRDKKTGDSLQYAFIEFDERESAEQAYFKMDSVLIDNQRIRVDFSQSVSKLHGRWIEARTGRKQPAAAATAPSRARRSPSPRRDYDRQRPRRSPSSPGQRRHDGGRHHSRGERSGRGEDDSRRYRSRDSGTSHQRSDRYSDHDRRDREDRRPRDYSSRDGRHRDDRRRHENDSYERSRVRDPRSRREYSPRR